MLIKKLNVTLADLMPIKGVAVSLVGENTPYRISDRLHAALKDEAAKQGVMVSAVLRAMRDELHQSEQLDA